MARTKGEIRRSQLITTYGVGSIVALQDESFMVAGVDQWQVPGVDLHEPRLERQLHVDGFVAPPATESDPDIPVVRFPNWHYCPACKRLDEHRFFTVPTQNRCGTCEVPLVPSRFVMACRRGHIDDFPYFRWVHAGSPPTGDRHHMTIESGGATASLRDIVISCSCGKLMTLDGAFAKTALRQVTRCTGRRPWLRSGLEECEEVPRTLQRGASNVWFSVTRSALSIPPWSEGAFKILNRHWTLLRHAPNEALESMIHGAGLAEGTAYSVADLVEAARRRKADETDRSQTTSDHLREEEYEALVRGREERSRDQDFVCTSGELGRLSAQFLDAVMLVRRLREVRVLESFTRVQPPSPATPQDHFGTLYDDHPGWLPGIDVTGEGVFIRLRADAVASWESRPQVQARAAVLDANYSARFDTLGLDPDRRITPRLLMMHTLAHVLIDYWSLESGYPAASLRERLYTTGAMAGLLLYTATTDSAGSLGGVVAQAEPERLDQTLAAAIAQASWCSADPVCIESDASGVDALNLAACHACALLPEVSCEERNVLLDRAMLIGTIDQPEIGFFRPLRERA